MTNMVPSDSARPRMSVSCMAPAGITAVSPSTLSYALGPRASSMSSVRGLMRCV